MHSHSEASEAKDPKPSLASVKSWNLPSVPVSLESFPTAWYDLQPQIPGVLLHVHETGWGAVTEIFKAALWQIESEASEGCEGLSDLTPLVTLQFLHRLPEDEVLAVPHVFELGDSQWHLVALICQDHRHLESLSSVSVVDDGLQSMAQPQSIVFLHGASESSGAEWLFEKGYLQELHRRTLPSSSLPPSWLCTRNISPEFIVFVKGKPKGTLRALPRAEGIPGSLSDRSSFCVRIVTEKACLERSLGGF